MCDLGLRVLFGCVTSPLVSPSQLLQQQSPQVKRGLRGKGKEQRSGLEGRLQAGIPEPGLLRTYMRRIGSD